MIDSSNNSAAFSALHLSALGSCRIYKPLEAAAEHGVIRSFKYLFPHIHTPFEIQQAIDLLDGRPFLRELGAWLNFSAGKIKHSGGFDALTTTSSVIVIELSSVRRITYEGFELQLNTFRQNLAKEGVSKVLIAALHRPKNHLAARAEILELPLEPLTRSIVQTAVFQEAADGALQNALIALRERVRKPLMLVGMVDATRNGGSVEKRQSLNTVMHDFAASTAETIFFNPTEFVLQHGYDVAMEDASHYNPPFIPLVGEQLARAASTLLTR